MTKKFNRIISALLAFVMVFAACSFSVFAEDADQTTYSITVSDSDDTATHTYNAYQIFKGDVSGTTLSNIEWGDGVSLPDPAPSAEEAAKYIAANYTGNSYDDDGAITTTSYEGSDIVKYLEETLRVTINSTAANPLTKGDNGYSVSGLSAGYYLVKDESTGLNNGDSNSSYLIEVLGASVTLNPKKDVVDVDKYVYEVNDSTTDDNDLTDANATTFAYPAADDSGWVLTADHDIGDAVPFMLVGKLPSNIADYETYKYVFHDTQCKGLDEPTDFVVTIGGVVVKSGYTLNIEKNTDGYYTFDVTFDDIKKCYATDDTLISVDDTTKVVVTYRAVLNENAVIGSTGNDNTVYLEYSNNPNDSGTGTTTEKKVVVFTFNLLVNKVKSNDTNTGTEPLAGAGFTLYKKNSSNTYDKVEEITGVSSFLFTGLDAGEYKIVETTTPEGYNTISPIEFTVAADYDPDTESSTGYSVTALTVTSSDATFTTSTSQSSDFKVTTADEAVDGINEVAAGSTTTISTDVLNNKGTTMPETGGIGTKIFYVLGGILVVGAIVLLITKRRMKKA